MAVKLCVKIGQYTKKGGHDLIMSINVVNVHYVCIFFGSYDGNFQIFWFGSTYVQQLLYWQTGSKKQTLCLNELSTVIKITQSASSHRVTDDCGGGSRSWAKKLSPGSEITSLIKFSLHLCFSRHVVHVDRRTTVNFAPAPVVSTSCVTLGRAPFTLWTSGPSSVPSTTASPSEAGTTSGSPTPKWMVSLANQYLWVRRVIFVLSSSHLQSQK